MSRGLALVFIADGLAVIKDISRRILMMYQGREMGLAEKHALYDPPLRERGKAIRLLNVWSGAQRPMNCGGRFCAKARTASWWSWLRFDNPS